MGDDDKSWRDIDRERDKSSHVTRDDDQSSRRDKRSNSTYKRKLERVFESGGQVPDEFEDAMSELQPEEGTEEAERKEAIDDLREADGFRAFAKEVNVYLQKGYRLPEDEAILLKMLDHPDDSIVRKTLQHLVDLGERRELRRKDPLRNRLSTLRTMYQDPEMQQLADDLEEALDKDWSSGKGPG